MREKCNHPFLKSVMRFAFLVFVLNCVNGRRHIIIMKDQTCVSSSQFEY